MQSKYLAIVAIAGAAACGVVIGTSTSQAATCTLPGTPFFQVGEIRADGSNCNGSTKRASALGSDNIVPARLRVNNFDAISASATGIDGRGVPQCITPTDTTPGRSIVTVDCPATVVTHTLTTTF